jgi:NAD(P)-dependent dehydrogenase (short-subunit alcohol dehydrogenase family)
VSAPETARGRLAGKVAIVTGAGQTPGERIGNGRATAILFAREGARVVLFNDDESLFLASEEARFITGALLPVDGGQSTRVGEGHTPYVG